MKMYNCESPLGCDTNMITVKINALQIEIQTFFTIAPEVMNTTSNRVLCPKVDSYIILYKRRYQKLLPFCKLLYQSPRRKTYIQFLIGFHHLGL